MAEESCSDDGKRLILHNFISPDQCKELEYIHKSNSTVGYRPNVFSTTLSHLAATDSSHFILPFVNIRVGREERALDGTVMITDLISNNVCYLNTYEKDFKGGLFHFQDAEPSTLVPMAEDVAIYTADSCNIHSVDEVTDGERLTLTLWFSRDSNHDEDAKLISILSKNMLHSSTGVLDSYLPLPASSNMYWFSQNQSCMPDVMELLIKPLQLSRGDELFGHEFSNALHALQVVQFYCWKGCEFENHEVETSKRVRVSSHSEREIIDRMKTIFVKDLELADGVFNTVIRDKSIRQPFDWGNFFGALIA